MLIRTDKIVSDPGQPRKTFKGETLEELGESISSLGLINPLTVRPTGDGKYMIIVGARRWLAAKKAGLSEVECIIRNDVDDKKVREMQFAENYQYEEIPPLEQAKAWKDYIDRFDSSQGELSRKTGIPARTISSRLSLLVVPSSTRAAIEKGEIGPREGMIIAGLPKERQEEVTEAVRQGKIGGRKLDEFAPIVRSQPSRPSDDIIDEVVYGVKHIPKEELELAKPPETMLDIGFRLEEKILDLSQTLTAYDLSRIPAGQRQALVGALKILMEKIRLALEFLTGKKLTEIEGIIEGEAKQLED